MIEEKDEKKTKKEKVERATVTSVSETIRKPSLVKAVDVSFCASLRNYIQIGPPSAEKNDVDFQNGGSRPSWILGI